MLKLTLLVAASFSAMAQETPPHDYGQLIPNHKFEITVEKASLKDSADVPNYEIETKGRKQTFTYHWVQNKKNGKALKVSKKQSVMMVEKDADGKVYRAAHKTYIGDVEEPKLAQQQLTTFSLNEDGSVRSHTSCEQSLKLGWLGEKNHSGFECVTVNQDVCELLDKMEKKNDFSKKLKECKDTLEKYSENEAKLRSFSDEENESDMLALKGLDSDVKGSRQFFEMDHDDYASVARLESGYQKARHNCRYLKDNRYFEPRKYTPPQVNKKTLDRGSIQ